MTPTASTDRWQARPVLSGLLRAAVVAVPVAASMATAIVVSNLLPKPDGGLQVITWWASFAIPSVLVLVATDRVLRRLLPLAALLQLSLLFPDRAPSRIQIARKAGRVRDLKKQVAEAHSAGLEDPSTAAAESLLTLVSALAAHDRGTRGHSERTRVFTDLLAQELHLPAADRDLLRWGGLLHDVGKLSVPSEILLKEDTPTPEEFEILKRHPEEGMRIAASVVPWLGKWAGAIQDHHERYGGGGYPKGLVGSDISLAGRIVAVADSYDTMTQARPYKKPVSVAAAREELARCAGSHFEPALVRAFLNISIGRLWRTIGLLSWFASLPFLPRAAVASTVKAGRHAVTGTATAVAVLAAGITALPAAIVQSPSTNSIAAPSPDDATSVLGATITNTPPLPIVVSQPLEALLDTGERDAPAAATGRPSGTSAASSPRSGQPPAPGPSAGPAGNDDSPNAPPPPPEPADPPGPEHKNRGKCVSERARSEPSPGKGEEVSDVAREDCR